MGFWIFLARGWKIGLGYFRLFHTNLPRPKREKNLSIQHYHHHYHKQHIQPYPAIFSISAGPIDHTTPNHLFIHESLFDRARSTKKKEAPAFWMAGRHVMPFDLAGVYEDCLSSFFPVHALCISYHTILHPSTKSYHCACQYLEYRPAISNRH